MKKICGEDLLLAIGNIDDELALVPERKSAKFNKWTKIAVACVCFAFSAVTVFSIGKTLSGVNLDKNDTGTGMPPMNGIISEGSSGSTDDESLPDRILIDHTGKVEDGLRYDSQRWQLELTQNGEFRISIEPVKDAEHKVLAIYEDGTRKLIESSTVDAYGITYTVPAEEGFKLYISGTNFKMNIILSFDVRKNKLIYEVIYK
jgi:hypothetical protein